MKKVGIVIICILVLCGIGYMGANSYVKNENKNEVLMTKSYISKGEFLKAQNILDQLNNSDSNITEQEKQLGMEIKSDIDKENYENLKPFLMNNTLDGKIEGKFAVKMILKGAKESNGRIIAKEVYIKYPNQILDLSIISSGNHLCKIDESIDGNPVGIYRLEFNDKGAKGTYEYAPSGKTTPISLSFEN